MDLPRSTPDDQTEQTRWWAVGIALALTAVVSYLAVSYYQTAIPRGYFEDGVLAIQGQEWGKVQRFATTLQPYPKFTAQRAYLLGAIELNRGELDKAERYFDEALKSAEVKPRALALQGVIAYQKGDLEKARELVNQSLELDSDLFEAVELEKSLLDADQPLNRVARCMAYLGDGNLEQLEKELTALKENPRNEPYVNFVAGMVCMRTEKYLEALNLFGKAQEVPELAPQTLVVSAEALVRLGNVTDAVGLLQRALSLDANLTDAHRWLASIYYDQGLDDLTVGHLTKVAELDPTDFRPDRQMGLMCLQFQDYEGATAHYQEALRRNPVPLVEAEILLELAQAQVKLNQFEAAMATLDNPLVQAITEPSYMLLVKSTRADANFQSGKLDEALKLADEVLKSAPNNVEAAIVKGTVLLQQDKPTEAVRVLEDATRYDPYNYEAHYQLALAYQRTGQTQAATDTNNRAQQLKKLREDFSEMHNVANREPNNIQIRMTLASTAMQLGLPRMAVNWYRSVLALDPANESARTELQRLIDAGVLQQ